MQALWVLPGPGGFLRRLVDALHTGENAVLCLPALVPPGLPEALEESVAALHQLDFVTLNGSRQGPPVAAVLAATGPGSGRWARATVETLLDVPVLHGRVFWVEGITPATWPGWRRFLGDYAHAGRAASPHLRPSFVVPLVGDLATDPPAEDVGLRRHRWDDVLGELDVLLLAGRLLHRRQLPAGMRTLLAWTLVEVALWDAELVWRLSDTSVDEILHPERLLCEVARERGWTVGTPADWCWGTVARFDGVRMEHSAALALQGRRRELQERLWRAQVATAMPVVEAQRQELLRDGRAFLRPPFCFEGRTIENPLDLEVGPLATALLEARAPWPLVRRANRLRDVRNNLAHLKCVEPAELLELMNGQGM